MAKLGLRLRSEHGGLGVWYDGGGGLEAHQADRTAARKASKALAPEGTYIPLGTYTDHAEVVCEAGLAKLPLALQQRSLCVSLSLSLSRSRSLALSLSLSLSEGLRAG
jgi:hypothetical protein